VPVLAPQFQLGGNGDEDDEEEEGVLDREGSNIEDDGDEVRMLENFFLSSLKFRGWKSRMFVRTIFFRLVQRPYF
jgi:hypothetical protein